MEFLAKLNKDLKNIVLKNNLTRSQLRNYFEKKSDEHITKREFI